MTRSKSPLFISLVSLITIALAACSGGGSGPGTPAADTTAPQLAITSPGVSVSAEYSLTGAAWDDTGIQEASYSLGGDEAALSVTDGEFSTTITLEPGQNLITVTASDAAGNEGTASRTVLFGTGELVASSEIAMRGASLDLAGNFGPGGSVTVGGVAATVSSWGPDAVTIQIPADAPSGWTEVVVNSNEGTASAELFVGTSFAPGALDDLAALGLPVGTAVMLESGDYTVTSAPVVLDGLSLYGAGDLETTITTGGSDNALRLIASADLVIRDLSLFTDGTYIVSSELGTASTVAMPDPFSGSAIDFAAALAEQVGGQLSPQATRHAVTLENLLIEHTLGTSMISFAVSDVARGSVFAGPLTVRNVQVDTAGVAMFVASGSVNFADSDIDSSGGIVISIAGDLVASDSVFETNGLMAGMVGALQLEISDVDFTQRNGDLSLGSLAAESESLVSPQPGFIRDSSFRVYDPDPVTPPEYGYLVMALIGGPTVIRDNTFVAHHSVLLQLSIGSIVIEQNSFTLGAPGAIDALFSIRQQDQTTLRHVIRNNSLSWESPGGLDLHATQGEFELSGNTLAGAGAGTAMSIYQEDGLPDFGYDMLIQDNVFSDFTNAFHIQQHNPGPTAEADIVISGNTFDFEFTAAPQVAEVIDFLYGTIDASGNQWGSVPDAATARSYVTETGTPIGTFVIDDVVTP